ncbi:MAG TPA: autotransporter domain-containing protein [Allosphingosinicella sp.]|nr:autotransporter domain-containing protein [Allosphingosinicella sp.]
MRHLLAATCLTPVALLALAAPASAETVISDARTAPQRTSTVNGGAPDDIRIAAQGSVKPSGGNAVTIDSDDSVSNEGTIQITGANDSSGIFANAGRTGSISNSGKIILDESYTPEDADKDGDVDGPFAQGARRLGIFVGSGGTFTGAIANSGTITIEGNDSAGIRLDSRLAGSLSSTGTIDVLGNNSYGVHTGDVTGNVTLNGTLQTRGANSVAAALDGDIGGRLTVQGSLTATGYRSILAPADPSKLDADDLLQGGPALRVAGDVAGGILFDAPPPDASTTDDDEDGDGVKDAQEGTASVRSYGAAPAVQIGSATSDVTIGAVAGNSAGHGIVVRGVIAGSGVYSGVSGNGLVIGGLGGQVTVAGGLTVSGAIGADANNANATAIRIGADATVPALVNSGQIVAVSTGTQGTATAIGDSSATLGLVQNSGTIRATGAPAASDGAVAIDLRANGGGATVRQVAAAQNAPAPQIVGNILFGGGDDVLEVGAGSVTGTTHFGAGADRLSLAGSAVYVGTADFGGGADTLVLAGTSRLTGALSGSSGLAVNVGGGTLDLTNSGTVALSSLNVGSQGAIRVNLNGAAHTLYDVAGEASFASGSKLLVNLGSTAGSEGDFVIVRAGTLTGGSNLAVGSALLPFLYASTLSANTGSGELSLNIRRKTASELGLNRSEASAYGAVYAALSHDADIEDVFLAIGDGSQFRSALQQMLPEHAGGAFETVTQASRATGRFLADPRPPVHDMGGWGFFLQQVAWGTTRDIGDTSGYDVSGWGASGGAEINAGGLGAFGVSLSYLLGDDADGTTENQVDTEQVELAGYWRGHWGGLNAYARASAARIGFDSVRRFTGTAVTREARGEWNGTLWSAGGGVSYEIRSGRLTVRPLAALDYYSLDEGGYTEAGGGEGFGLTVDGRSSDELAASGSVTLGYDLAGTEPTGGFFRVELEGGRREIVGGSLGATVARFENGQPFTLTADERSSGWLGRLRLLGGSANFRVGGEFSAEEQDGHAAIAFRLSLNSAF